MVELRAGPFRSGVAARTIRREAGGHVVRVCGFVEVLQVAASALRWCISELIVQVALVAGHVHMCACQGELGRSIVVELRARPRGRRMAHRASRWKAGCAVIWIGGVVEILEMAAGTVGRNGGVVPADMALCARYAHMCARQGKLCQIMVELGVLPAGCSVTCAALRGKVEALVIWIGRLRVIGQVATGAVGGSAGKPAVNMAGGAIDANVCPGQRKFCFVVIEDRTLPGCRGVTSAAIVRECGGQVVWVRSGCVSLGMTPIAFSGRALEPVAGMAGRTRELRVRTRQTKVCELRMIELGALPLIHRVAGFAGHRQIGGNVIQRSPLLEIALMAADTRRA